MSKIKFSRALAVFLCIALIFSSSASIAFAESITSTELVSGKENTQSDVHYLGIDNVDPYLEEDVSSRDIFTKYYIDPDGNRYAVVFPEQVHYKEGDKWLEVNNTLRLLEANDTYVSNNKLFKTSFSKSFNNDQLVSIEDDKFKLSWGILFNSDTMTATTSDMITARAENVEIKAVLSQSSGNNTTKSKSNISELGTSVSSVKYAGVYNANVDLKYSVFHGKIKEDIILKSPDDFSSYTLVINAYGLSAEKRSDNSVSFLDAEGSCIFTIGSPWMKDSDVSVSDNIDVTVTQHGNTVLVTYNPDKDWLNDVSRVYPVLIDPSVTTRVCFQSHQ